MRRKDYSSMKIKSIRRQGIQALYTFTPFKLLRAETGEYYTLLLAPVAYFETFPELRWRSKSYKASFKVTISSQVYKRVVHPHQIYPIMFQEKGKEHFVFKRENIEGKSRWMYPPTYMEFSWSALNRGYYCRLGWTLLSSQPRCPQERYCPYLKGNPCRFYSRKPIPYTSLYNVYPRIQKKFEDPSRGFMFLPIFAIRYKDSPLAVLRFTDRGSFVAFIDGVVFSPKLPWIFSQPMVFLKEGLGFEIGNVHAIELEFQPEILNNFIKDILLSDIETARWVVLKYKLYLGELSNYGFIREKRGFEAFRKLEIAAEQLVQNMKPDRAEIKKIIKDVSEGKVTSEIVDFACVLFLHSFAHALKNAIAARYGCKTEDIGYYIEHPKLRGIGVSSGKLRVVIFETAIGGLGYIKSFVEDIRKTLKPEVLENLIYAIVQGIKKSCEEKVEKSLKNLKNELLPFRNDYERLVDSIYRLYNNLFPSTGVYPHVNSVRNAIAKVFPEFSEEERSLLDDLLAKGPHCWDGCQLCVMIERGCNFMPLDQPFLVSERILKLALEVILAMIKQPISFSPLKEGVKKDFDTLLSAARFKIDLASPWISTKIVDDLLNVYSQRRIKIRLITKLDPKNKAQIQSINRLVQVSRDYYPGFQVRISDNLHAKGMLVDEVMLLHGSFNFTLSGLYANVENVSIDFSLESINKFKEKFERIWKKGEPLT